MVAVAIVYCLRPMAVKWRVGILLMLFVGSVATIVFVNSGTDSTIVEVSDTGIPAYSTDGGFVRSDTCRECHPQQHASWHRSYHRTMTQLASTETVVAPFAGTELEFQGMVYRLERNEDRFFVSVLPPGHVRMSGGAAGDGDHPVDRREIVMTTGSHHIQVYWVSEPTTRQLIELPFYYHIAEGRWILRDDTMLRPPNEIAVPSIWNERCIKCHSVNGVPGLDLDTGVFASHVAELGISCEACHGPGEAHVNFQREQSAHGGLSVQGGLDETIVNPRNLDHVAATQVCARCHSASHPKDPVAFMTQGLGYRPGDDLHDWVELNDYDPKQEREPDMGRGELFVENYAVDGYWKDGTCRVGGDEYNALILSPCFQKGEISCLSCHSLHQGEPDDQLAAEAYDNRACTQCHKQPMFNEELTTHTHHAADSQGSSCYNCHMPYTSYALLTAMRSHRIDSPSVSKSVQAQQPNACNLCHIDKTLKWTSGHLSAWFDIPETELRPDEENVAASLLWLLKGDAALRIIAAWHFGWAPAHEAAGDGWQAAFLAVLLDDRYSAVRDVAAHSLKKLPGFAGLQYDFVGPPADRRNAVIAVQKRWEETRRPVETNWESLLLDMDGSLRVEEVKRLLLRRDLRPVSIAE